MVSGKVSAEGRKAVDEALFKVKGNGEVEPHVAERLILELNVTHVKIWAQSAFAADMAAVPLASLDIFTDDGELLQVRTGPGGLNVFNGLPGDGLPLQPLPTGADHRITDVVIRQKQEAVKAAFHAQLLQLFEDPKMTATQVIELANQGLSVRGRLNSAGDNETGFLEPLQQVADSGVTPAERKLKLYRGDWNGSVDPMFTECSY